jgi:hypothetical protein
MPLEACSAASDEGDHDVGGVSVEFSRRRS